jgi:hypothetical protein
LSPTAKQARRGNIVISKLAAVAVVAATALAGASAATAANQAKTRYRHYPANYVDDTLCSFPVQVNGYDNATETDVYDAGGNLVRQVFNDKFVGTVTGPTGVTLDKSENATIIQDLSTGTEEWKGLAERYAYQNGGGVIAQDTGDLVFDANGNIVYEKGPHPIIEGPGTDAVCSVLSGA